MPLRVPTFGDGHIRLALQVKGLSGGSRRLRFQDLPGGDDSLPMDRDLELRLTPRLLDLTAHLGRAFLPERDPLTIEISEGGRLVDSDPETRTLTLADCVLHPPKTLHLDEAGSALLLSLVLRSAARAMAGEKCYPGLRRFTNNFGQRIPDYHNRALILMTLDSLADLRALDLSLRRACLDALRVLETALPDDRQPFADLVEATVFSPEELELEAVVRATLYARAEPARWPDLVDPDLMKKIDELRGRRSPGEAATEVLRYASTDYRVVRDCEALWRGVQEPRRALEALLANPDRRPSSELIREVGGQTDLRTPDALVRTRGSRKNLEPLARALEELVIETRDHGYLGQAGVLGVQQLAVRYILEQCAVSDFPGDQLEFISALHSQLTDLSLHEAASVLVRFRESLRTTSRRRATGDLRRDAVTSRRRAAARTLVRRLTSAVEQLEGDPARAAELLTGDLLTSPDLEAADVSAVVNELYRAFFDHPVNLTRLESGLEAAARRSDASPAFRAAVRRRYSLLHDREPDLSGMSLEHLTAMLLDTRVFETQVPEFEDQPSRLELSNRIREALDREEGILQGRITGRKRLLGGTEPIDTHKGLAAVRAEMERLERAHSRGRSPRDRQILADAHFRLGAYQLAQDHIDTAISHLREAAGLLLTPELINATFRIDDISPEEFRAGNEMFQQRVTDVRRIKVAVRALESVRAGSTPAAGGARLDQVQLAKIDSFLATTWPGPGRPPTTEVARRLPIVRELKGTPCREWEFLAPGAGGQAGQMALLRHLFAGEPFAPFMGYREVAGELQTGSIQRYISKIGLNDYVIEQLRTVFSRIFPTFEAEMARQRHAVANQLFASAFVSGLARALPRLCPELADVLRPVTFLPVRLGTPPRDCRLLLVEHVRGLLTGIPKSRHGQDRTEDGRLQLITDELQRLDAALTGVRKDLARSIQARERVTNEEYLQGLVDQRLARMRALSAALACVLTNVDHQVFVAGGQLIPLDLELILPQATDPAWIENPGDPSTPRSWHFTRRVNVAWVSRQDDPAPYRQAARAVQEFVTGSRIELADWAVAAGYPPEMATAVVQCVLAQSGRLPEAVAAVLANDGTALVGCNPSQAGGFGHILSLPVTGPAAT